MVYKDILRQRAKKVNEPKAITKFGVHEIIKAPIVTEKSMQEAETMGMYTFKVHDMSNKIDVKLAVEAMFKVTPKSIKMMTVPYKKRANRGLVRQGYKKAVVILKKGDTLPLAG